MTLRPTERPNLSAKQLQCVVSLARFGSFVAAAADMGMSQPALTRAIKQVERAVGVQLFTRSTRRVALTAAGQEFVPTAERLLADLEISVQNMRALGARRRGQLVIACLMSVGYGLLPDLIATYRRRHREVELQIREGVNSAIHEDVRSGLADFGVGDLIDVHESIEAEPLHQERFHVALPRDHRLAKRRRLRMEDLKGETLITMPFGAGSRRLIDGAAAARGVAFDQTITVNQFATTFNLVRVGVGLSIVPEAALSPRQDEDLSIRPLADPNVSRRLGILRLRSRPLSPAAEGFIETLQARFRTLSR